MMILHFPSILLFVGYFVFWIELYWVKLPGGQTSFLATTILLMASVYCLRKSKLWIKRSTFELRKQWTLLSVVEKVFLLISLIGIGGILGFSFYASLFPPHLLPESDLLNYHYTLPRQHLVRHTFSHIPWSTADLWFMPLQLAMAPYWFVTVLPNKLPQFFFTFSLSALSFRIAYRLMPIGIQKKIIPALLVVMALTGSHGFGIQYGTGMLDIPICYLFVAGIDSFQRKQWVFFGGEMAFLLFSKTFLLFQISMILLLIGCLIWFAKRYSWTIGWVFDTGRSVCFQGTLKGAKITLFMSILVGGVFLFKSTYYSGTPFYPFGMGKLPPITSAAEEINVPLKKSADALIEVRNSYGSGRTIKNFVTHFWKIAVPNKGVNNEFDYPLGLPYLLFLLPFVFFLMKSLKGKHLPLIPVMVILFWGSWWMGSQQSRWLYIPLVLIFISVSLDKVFSKSWVMRLALLFSIGITGVSMLRGNMADFGKSGWDVLGTRDQYLVKLGSTIPQDLKKPIPVAYKEVAYATFPVFVTTGDSHFIIPRTERLKSQKLKAVIPPKPIGKAPL